MQIVNLRNIFNFFLNIISLLILWEFYIMYPNFIISQSLISAPHPYSAPQKKKFKKEKIKNKQNFFVPPSFLSFQHLFIGAAHVT